MSDRERANRYSVAQIYNFDARHGYRRCPLPGVGVSVGRGPSALADFWRTRGGNVVARFSSSGYQYSFVACLSNGDPIPDKRLSDFGDHVSELLLLWLSDGVDDTPTTDI